MFADRCALLKTFSCFHSLHCTRSRSSPMPPSLINGWFQLFLLLVSNHLSVRQMTERFSDCFLTSYPGLTPYVLAPVHSYRDCVFEDGMGWEACSFSTQNLLQQTSEYVNVRCCSLKWLLKRQQCSQCLLPKSTGTP